MAHRIDLIQELVRNLMLGLFATVLVGSCASGDVSESYESLTLNQEKVPICCGAPCQARPCMTASCGLLPCCVYKPVANGVACETPDSESGQCVAGQCCACPGTDLQTGQLTCLNCDDRNPCTTDGCERGRCVNRPVVDGATCGGGRCIAGKCCTGCVDKEGTCRTSGSGDPEFCGLGGGICDLCEDDGNPCTDDICSQGKCLHPARGNGVSCDDGDVCNGTSSCHNGSCLEGKPLSCPSGNVCVRYSCDSTRGCVPLNTTEFCSDQDPCTTGDRCRDGTCRPGEPVTCNDNELCTDDSCDPETGGCVYRPVAQNTQCNDRNECTQGDVCNQGSCVGTSGMPCQDSNPCTINGCNPNTNLCFFGNFEEVDTPCLAPNKCLVNTRCNAEGQCTGVEKDCNDNNPCTTDDCNPTTGQCTFQPLDQVECNDDSVCTQNDRCESGQCVGDPIECAALDDCHAPGKCDDETGLCSDPRLPRGTECASGTGTCDNGGRCEPNPTTGAGGAFSDAGAPGEAGSPGKAGGPATGGTSGDGPTAAAGEENPGEDGDPELERGRPFVRDPGGCACRVPARPEPSQLPLLWLASLVSLAWMRRRST